MDVPQDKAQRSLRVIDIFFNVERSRNMDEQKDQHNPFQYSILMSNWSYSYVYKGNLNLTHKTLMYKHLDWLFFDCFF